MDPITNAMVTGMSESIAVDGAPQQQYMRNCLQHQCMRVLGKARSKFSKGACIDRDMRKEARTECRALQTRLMGDLNGWCTSQCGYALGEDRAACIQQCAYAKSVSDDKYKECFAGAQAKATTACFIDKCRDDVKACAEKHCKLATKP